VALGVFSELLGKANHDLGAVWIIGFGRRLKAHGCAATGKEQCAKGEKNQTHPNKASVVA
jgi:hypothetical protein